MDPSRATCRGYGTQMLFMHSQKAPRSTSQTGKTETNGEASNHQKKMTGYASDNQYDPVSIKSSIILPIDSVRKSPWCCLWVEEVQPLS